MANIYVSPAGNDVTGDGSSGNPYLTIAKANNTAIDLDVIICKDGTYIETYIPVTVDLTIKSESDDYTKVIINYTQSNTNQSLLVLAPYAAKTLILKDLTLYAHDLSGLINLEAGGQTNYLEVIRCHFQADSNTYWGISAYFAAGVKLYKSTFRGFLVTGDETASNAAMNNGTPTDIQDCIFEGNGRALFVYNGTLNGYTTTGNHNSFYNNIEDFVTGYDNAYGANDLTIDPLFLTATSAEIDSLSPCVDAGILVSGYITTQKGLAPDIGVFELVNISISETSIIEIDITAKVLRTYLKSDISPIEIVSTFDIRPTQKEIGTSSIEAINTFEIKPTIRINEYSSIEVNQTNTTYKEDRVFISNAYVIDIRTGKYILSELAYEIDIRTGAVINQGYSIDVRCGIKPYNLLSPKKITDFHIYLDSIELMDMDIESGIITYNLGITPSTFSVVLARRHDNPNYTLSGVYSEITNENKITIYDGTKLLYTGYITTIEERGTSDTVNITAEDKRYQFNRMAPTSIFYGYFSNSQKEALIEDGHTEPIFNTVSDAIANIISETGLSANPIFTSEFDLIVQGTNITDTHLQLLNILITEVGTYQFYLDENETLQLLKIGMGDLKTLSLSSLDQKRKIFDIINDDIVLNREGADYTTGLKVIHGKKHFIRYTHWTFYGIDTGMILPEHFWKTPLFQDQTFFGFQAGRYVGQRVLPIAWEIKTNDEIIKDITLTIQCKLIDAYINVPDTFIGTGTNKKEINFSQFTIEDAYPFLSEISEVFSNGDTTDWFAFTCPAIYNKNEYAIDLAYLDLNKRNKLQTTGTVSILLDAIEYYNIKLSDSINITNTIDPTIYNNNNGFPLNISSMSLTLKDRVTTLSLTNYGASFYKRNLQYTSGISREEYHVKIQRKEDNLRVNPLATAIVERLPKLDE